MIKSQKPPSGEQLAKVKETQEANATEQRKIQTGEAFPAGDEYAASRHEKDPDDGTQAAPKTEPATSPEPAQERGTPSADEARRARAEADAQLAALSPQKPSTCRAVLYTDREGVTFPATVVDVDLMQPLVVGLFVMTMRGSQNADAVPFYDGPDDAKRFHSWRWPPRV